MTILYKLRRLSGLALAHCKITLAFTYMLLHKRIRQSEIWLITEKRNEARDNGYWLFKYIKENHAEVNAYFVISRNAPDREKLSAWEDCLIEPDSLKHCIYYLAAVRNISSQNDGAYPFWKTLRRKDLLFWKKHSNPDQLVVFLQHGVIKDEIPHEAFDHDKNPMDCFIVSAERERKFVLETYGYPPACVPLLGLCRFDHLYRKRHAADKSILLMPTWRVWLQPQRSDRREDAYSRFTASHYYITYWNLLTSERLRDLLQKHGFRLYFYPHYEMQKYIHAFDGIENDVIRICPKEDYDVQDLLIRAKIMITDYSSVFFDFAYMDKPLIYYQFDREAFEKTHYLKGYFDYEEDGFGPVLTDQNALITYLSVLLEPGCVDISRYRRRSAAFFPFFDDLSSKRNYEYIKGFEKVLEGAD